MKRILEKININNLNNSLYFFQKILKIIYVLLILIITYFIIVLFKEFNIFKMIKDILKILSPLFLGIIISYILNPIIKKLSLKLNRKVSTVIVYLLILFILSFIIIFIYPKFLKEINELIKSFPKILNILEDMITNISNKKFKIHLDNIIMKYLKNNVVNKISDFIKILKNIFEIIGIVILSLIISFYISLNFDEKVNFIFNKLPLKNKKKKRILLKQINERLYSYLKGTILLTIIIFILSIISFKIVNLKSYIFFSFYNAITNVIPYIGPYIGGIPIILVSFTISKKVGILSTILILIIQLLESYIFHPLIMSKSMDLDPITILISLLIFGYFFGILGMIISIPVTSILKLIFIYIYKNKVKK